MSHPTHCRLARRGEVLSDVHVTVSQEDKRTEHYFYVFGVSTSQLPKSVIVTTAAHQCIKQEALLISPDAHAPRQSLIHIDAIDRILSCGKD